MNRVSTSVLLVSIALLVAVLPLLTGQRFAFRDVSHFYLPLYDYVAMRCSAEWLPLWNPLDHMGMPLIGESTTAVLYPVRYLVYCLPLTSPVAMNVYLMVHLALAAAAAGWLASHGVDASNPFRPTAIATAAISYPLSGSVFGLCCNPPFLVGAAWLPLFLGASLLANDGSLSIRKRIAIAALALTMMVLGGDPQIAFHAMIMTLAVSLVRLARSEGRSQLKSHLIVAFTAVFLTAGMAAIQIAASLDWSRISDRALSPRSHTEIYAFSLPPWHLSEVISARAMGTPFPANQRISRLIPGDGRMWTPSIYAGALVGLALLCRLLDWRQWFRDPWMAIAIGSLGLSMGLFGLVWWLQQVSSLGQDASSAAGGLYWILVEFFPGYDSFRYPAKWLPFFAIAASLSAANWVANPLRRTESILAMTLIIFSLIAAGCCQWLAAIPDWLAMHSQHAPLIDEYWGPLDMAAGFGTARNSWLLAAILMGAISFLRWQARKSEVPRWPSLAIICVLLLDCGMHAQTLLPRVDIETETMVAQKAMARSQQNLSVSNVAVEVAADSSRSMRTQKQMWPSHWLTEPANSSSSDRALEVAVTERVVWLGRWNLADRQALFNSMVSIRSQTMADFWRHVPGELRRRSRSKPGAGDREGFWRSFRRHLGIDSVCHVDARQTESIDGVTIPLVIRVQTDAMSSVRIFDSWIKSRSMPDWLRSLGTETDSDCPEVDFPPSEDSPVKNQTPPTVQTNLDGAIRVQTTHRCVLERHQFQDGNWRASAIEQTTGERIDLPVKPSRHFNQAVCLSPGRWQVEFQYRPWWVTPSISATILAWALFAFIGFWPSLSTRRRLAIVIFGRDR